jgi:hypothetical protein
MHNVNYLMNSEHIAAREQQYMRVIKYLNLAAAKQGNSRVHHSDEVFLQQARELSYCKGVEHLSDREYLMFLDLAFFKALKALYSRELLLNEKGIFSTMKLACSQDYSHGNELEESFDKVSTASQSRENLQNQCNHLRAVLKQIEAKAEELQSRKPVYGDKNDQAYTAFKKLSSEVHANLEVYEAKQNKHINETGSLNPAFAAECKEQCQISLKSAAPILSQHRGWGEILEKMLAAIKGFLFGQQKSESNNSITVIKTHSMLKLDSFSQALSKTL